MPRLMSLAWLAAAVLLGSGLLSPARAEIYHLNQNNCRIGFSVGTVGFFRARGNFERFTARLAIDPAHPTATRIEVSIPAASIKTPWAAENTMIRSAGFFDVGHYPTIRFKSRSVTATGPGRYSVNGMLTMRGVSRPVTLAARRVKSATEPATGAAIDDFTVTGIVDRRAFGMTADPLFIDNRVRIDISVRILLDAPGHG